MLSKSTNETPLGYLGTFTSVQKQHLCGVSKFGTALLHPHALAMGVSTGRVAPQQSILTTG